MELHGNGFWQVVSYWSNPEDLQYDDADNEHHVYLGYLSILLTSL